MDATVEMVRCSMCGRENRYGAKYCDECGTRLSHDDAGVSGHGSGGYAPEGHARSYGPVPRGAYQRTKRLRFLFNTITVNQDDPSRYVVISNRFMVRQRKVYSRGLWIAVNLISLIPLLFLMVMFLSFGGGSGTWWPMLIVLVPIGIYLSFFAWTMTPGTSALAPDEWDDL